MIDHHTEQRQAWLKTLQPTDIVWSIIATAMGATATLLALFI